MNVAKAFGCRREALLAPVNGRTANVQYTSPRQNEIFLWSQGVVVLVISINVLVKKSMTCRQPATDRLVVQTVQAISVGDDRVWCHKPQHAASFDARCENVPPCFALEHSSGGQEIHRHVN